MPHPAVRAAVRRLLHGPLPAAGPEPQLQVRAALLWIGQPLFNGTILFRLDMFGLHSSEFSISETNLP